MPRRVPATVIHQRTTLPALRSASTLAPEEQDKVVVLFPRRMAEIGSRENPGEVREADAAAAHAALARCRAGDVSALADLYRIYRKEALHYIRYAVRNGHEAEDILQEVFVEMSRTVKLFEGRSSFSSWLRKVCVRTAVRHM